MKTILGIDAAWTSRQPSGVALAVKKESGWSLRSVASSYEKFLVVEAKRAGAWPRSIEPKVNVVALLQFAEHLTGAPVDLVAVDMPLSLNLISGRRAADDLVSRAYGARHCSTHTPSSARPGKISDELREAFGALGYRLATTDISLPCLMEVYPHPALLELTGAPSRLPYKESKTRNYWPALSLIERRRSLLEIWSFIVAKLDKEIAGTSALLQLPAVDAKKFELKAFEDALDAVICCWVGICALNGKAARFGDESAAIWIPKSQPTIISQ